MDYSINNLDVTKITQPIIHKEWANYPVASTKFKYNLINDKRVFKRPKELRILTVSTYNYKTLFEKSCEHYGIHDYDVISEPCDTYKDIYKLRWIYNFLNNNKFSEKYILFSDARDAILQDDPQKILNIFLSKNCKLLFNGNEANQRFFSSSMRRFLNKHKYIDRKILDFFIDWKPITDHCKKKKDNLQSQLFDYSFKLSDNNTVFLCAGGFIGEIEYIKKVFKYILDAIEPYKGMSKVFENDEQLLVHFLPLFPDIKIDTYSEIWWRDTFACPPGDSPHKNRWNPPHLTPYKKGKSLYIV